MHDTVFDLCIIGAGFFGSVAARHASANPHLKICLIGLDEPSENEMADRDIFSSHYDEGRIVKAMWKSPSAQKIAQASMGRLRHLEKLSGIKFHNPVGFMWIGKKGSGVMTNLVDVCHAAGTSVLEVDDQNVMKNMFSFLKLEDDEYGLLENDGAGIIIARKMLQAEQKVALQQGCHIIFDLVKDVHPLKNNQHTVETGKHGLIKSKRILFACGAFINVNEFKLIPQLEMYVYREMVSMIKVSDREADRLRSMTGMIYRRDETHEGYYFLPPVRYPDGSYYLKVGRLQYEYGKGMQTSEEIKRWWFSKETPGEKESLAEIIFEKLPGLQSEGIYRKICVTCETPTGLPYIDQVTPTVTVAAVGNGWGATYSEEIGRIAANLSLTGIWDSELPKSLFEIVPKED